VLKRWRFSLLFLGAVLVACAGRRPPTPPPPPDPVDPSPVCEAGATCGCWQRSGRQDWQQLPPCTQPPPAGCVPALDPAMLPPLDNQTDWAVVLPYANPTRTTEVNDATRAAQAACPEAWSEVGSLSACLKAGAAGIDNGFAQIAAQLHARGVKAGQPYVEGDPGKRIDALNVASTKANVWEEWHLFYYGNGCLVGGPYKGSWLYVGSGSVPPPPDPPKPPVPPPATTGACSGPVPPKVAKWGATLINMWFDVTPQFYGKDTTRWDGSAVTGYCAAIGMPTRLFCPARNECKPPEEPGPQNFKCAERDACERIGVSGRSDGVPQFRCEHGEPELNPSNIFKARCGDGSTWIEVCASDGTTCQRESIGERKKG